MKLYDELKELVASMEADVVKFSDKGNAVAGTRIRKTLQEVKTLSQNLRIEIQETKNSEK